MTSSKPLTEVQPTRRRRALLVAIQLPKVSDQDMDSSLRELGRLVDTLGYSVCGRFSQRRQNSVGSAILGEGKLRELAAWTGGTGVIASSFQAKPSKAKLRFKDEKDGEKDATNAVAVSHESDEDAETDEPDYFDVIAPGRRPGAGDEVEEEEVVETAVKPPAEQAEVIIFDCELSPSQLRNLESATGVQVLDRTGVIIEIFSRHARTRAARLQVEIARLNYLAPRLRETGGGGDRQGGGVGGKGAGETAIELDRRRIRDRVKELKNELESVQSEHHVRRARRSSVNAVALVGYTNAGKSSLMRALTGTEVYVADRLFATLDTTVRPMHPESVPKVLISDTVGFIKSLPHDLVASFRSTLDEAANADLLLFVVDSSDATFREQLKVTHEVLAEVLAQTEEPQTPSRLVLNKCDLLTAEQRAELEIEYPDAIFLSTRDAADVGRMREKLLQFFEAGMIETELFVPYTTGGAIGEIREHMRVLAEEFNESGVRFKVRGLPDIVERVRNRYSLPS